MKLKADSPVLRITRGGETLWGPLSGDDWTVFAPNHSTYEPLATSAIQSYEDDASYGGHHSDLITVLFVSSKFAFYFLGLIMFFFRTAANLMVSSEFFSALDSNSGFIDFSCWMPCHFYLTEDSRQVCSATYKSILTTFSSARKELASLPLMSR